MQGSFASVTCEFLMDVDCSFIVPPSSPFLCCYFYIFSLASSTVPSLGSFVFPLSSPASLKALSISGYISDKLEFSFSGVIDVSSAVLMHWLLIIVFLQESVCTLLAPTHLILYPSLKYTHVPNSPYSLENRSASRYGVEFPPKTVIISFTFLFFSSLGFQISIVNFMVPSVTQSTSCWSLLYHFCNFLTVVSLANVHPSPR